jgi:hypothetical protein
MTGYVMLIIGILHLINTTFVQQSASDVHQKLQKMEGFTGANIDQLISIEAKVIANREEMAKREKEKYLEKKAKILAMALKEGDRKTGGRKGGPNRREWRKSLEKTSVPTVRRRNLGKMSALTRKKEKQSDSDCCHIQGSLQPRDKHSLRR